MDPPAERPHVKYKRKKAIQEERRQLQVVKENLRLLERTMDIMISSDVPTQFSNTRSPFIVSTDKVTSNCSLKVSPGIQISNQGNTLSSSSSSTSKLASKKADKYFDRPLTARLKRNTHIIFRWFIQRFGKYVPWWAEINYWYEICRRRCLIQLVNSFSRIQTYDVFYFCNENPEIPQVVNICIGTRT